MNLKAQGKSKPEFDPIEATRQIKHVIGIGQAPKPLMDIQPLMSDQKSKTKSSGQTLTSKGVSSSPPPPVPPPGRIPHQPVIFSDRFDGGNAKLDIQFGNLGESYDESLTQKISIPTSSSAFYHHSEPMTSMTKQNNASLSTENHQRTSEQLSYNSPSMRSTEQPVINQQRLLSSQMQQPAPIAMKPVVPPQYAVHQQQQQQQQQQQHQMNAPSMFLQSLLFHPQQQLQEVWTVWMRTGDCCTTNTSFVLDSDARQCIWPNGISTLIDRFH